MNINFMKRFLVTMFFLLFTIGLGGCGDDTVNSNSDDSAHSSVSTVSDDEDSHVGELGLMSGPNGVKPGIDMGNGLSIGMDGSVGLSFP